MLTVDRFLCFKLNTGGKILGWLGVIGSAIMIPVLSLLMSKISSVSCKIIIRIYEQFFADYTDKLGWNNCKSLREGFMISLGIFLALYILCFDIYILLLRGIATKSHKMVLPSVILATVAFVSYVGFMLFQLTIMSLIQFLLFGSFYFYISIVLYSLYVKFRDVDERGTGNVQFSMSQAV